MTDYRSGLWNDWTGSDTSPVMSGDLVEYFTVSMVGDGNEKARVMSAAQLDFEWIDDPSDIVKFRVIKKAEEV